MGPAQRYSFLSVIAVCIMRALFLPLFDLFRFQKIWDHFMISIGDISSDQFVEIKFESGTSTCARSYRVGASTTNF